MSHLAFLWEYHGVYFTMFCQCNEDITIYPIVILTFAMQMHLDSSMVTVIAQLPPVLSKHCLSVTPVVGVLSEETVNRLVPCPSEVDAIFTVPLYYFLEDNPRHSHRDATQGDFTYRIHHFSHYIYDIWGLTAGILIKVAEIAYGRSAEFDVLGSTVPYTALYFDGSNVRMKSKDECEDVRFDRHDVKKFSDEHL
jgi:hypothetical protein